MTEQPDADPAVAAVARWADLERAHDLRWDAGQTDQDGQDAAWQALVDACSARATTLAGIAAQLKLAAMMVAQLGPDDDLRDEETFAIAQWQWRDNLDGILLRNLVEAVLELAARERRAAD